MKRVITLKENEINKIVKNIIYKIDNNLLTEALANPSVIQDLYIKISNNKPASLKVMFIKRSVVVYGYSKGQFLTFFDNGRVKFHDGKSYFKGGGKWDYTMVKNNKLSGGWLKNASYKNVSLYDGLNNAYKNFGTSTTPDRDFKSDMKKRMQAGSELATINATKCPTNYKPVSSQEIASYKNSIKIPPWRDTRSLNNNYKTLKNGTVCQIIQTTWGGGTSGNNRINFNALVNVLFNARNSSWNDSINKRLFNKKSSIKDFALAIISWVKKNKNYNPILLQTAISTIFRESKAESAMLYLNPKEVLGMLHNIFGGDRSQGYAQIKPTTAKEYGIDMNSLYTFEGSLDAIYKMLLKNYQTAKKYYSGPTVTIYKDNKLTKTPSIGGNAALHMAIASHNVGTGILNNWCETNLPNIANKCSETKRVPDDSKPKEIATTNKNKKINNYYPNIGGVHKYTPQFKKSFDQLASVPQIVSNLISGT